MSTIKLRITADGRVRGLWNDTVDWPAIGLLTVRRASHVEFSQRRQAWYVRRARPGGWLRRISQWALRRPCGELLHWAEARADALAWEQEHFGPGGPDWRSPVTAHAPN